MAIHECGGDLFNVFSKVNGRPGRAARVLFAAAVALGVAGSAGSASAAVYLVDFNETAGTTGPGGTWNSYAAPGNVGGTLLDSSGGASSVSIAISAASGNISDSTQPASAVFNNTSPDSRPDWATSAANNGASGDYFFTSTNAAANTYSVVFGGLTAGNTVSVDLLASRNDGGAVGFYDYSLDGGSTWTGFRVLNSDGTPATGTWAGANTKDTPFANTTEGFNNHRYLNADALTLTQSTLQVRVTDSGNYAVINAIRLTTAVPEPASAGLLLAGAALSAGRRRPRRA